ncbi:MAG: glycine cleavage system protein GcvH [Desulfarculus sp.]|nr:glycine cleavage system protein GcvH [Desulfarculus sp.]
MRPDTTGPTRPAKEAFVNFPDDLLYSPGHLWVRAQGGTVTVGISDFAQDQLGRVVYVDLPSVGQAVAAGQEMGAVESAKSVSDLIAPVSGRVAEINEALADNPAPLNDDPYASGWLARIELSGALPAELVDAAAYRKLVGA